MEKPQEESLLGRVIYENPDDFLGEKGNLKNRFSIDAEKGAFYEALPDDDTCLLVAMNLRLATSQKYRDQDLVRLMKKYFSKAKNLEGDDFEFEVAIKFLTSVYEKAEIVWKRVYTKEEEKLLDRFLIHGETGFELPAGKEADPYEVGDVDEGLRWDMVMTVINQVNSTKSIDQLRKAREVLARAAEWVGELEDTREWTYLNRDEFVELGEALFSRRNEFADEDKNLFDNVEHLLGLAKNRE